MDIYGLHEWISIQIIIDWWIMTERLIYTSIPHVVKSTWLGKIFKSQPLYMSSLL